MKSRWIDTHCHLVNSPDNETFYFEHEAIKEVKEYLATAIVIPTKKRDNEGIWELLQEHDFLYAACGTHPCYVEGFNDELKQLYKQQIKALPGRIVAVGEIGLDYFHTQMNKELQKQVFIEQLEMAQEVDLPIIIHSRDAVMDSLDLIKEFPAIKKVVFHCFTGTQQEAKAILDQGYWISFTGPITFKSNHELRDVVRLVPLDRMMVETDSPYLPPVPHRGKPNRPIWVQHVGECVAACKELPIPTIEEQMFKNSVEFFSLPI